MKWSNWWFLNGGNIHRAWKHRQYSEIKSMAQILPKAAWDEQQKKIDHALKVLVTVKQHHQGGHSSVGALITEAINFLHSEEGCK